MASKKGNVYICNKKTVCYWWWRSIRKFFCQCQGRNPFKANIHVVAVFRELEQAHSSYVVWTFNHYLPCLEWTSVAYENAACKSIAAGGIQLPVLCFDWLVVISGKQSKNWNAHLIMKSSLFHGLIFIPCAEYFVDPVKCKCVGRVQIRLGTRLRSHILGWTIVPQTHKILCTTGMILQFIKILMTIYNDDYRHFFYPPGLLATSIEFLSSDDLLTKCKTQNL